MLRFSIANRRSRARMFSTPKIDQVRAALAEDHKVTPYYAAAEATELLDLFWGEDSLFLPLFERLDLASVVELACGRGRHTAQFLARAGRVTMVDVVQANIDACAKRFAGRGNMAFVRNNGRDLSKLRSGAHTALFSYDSMVHFEFGDVLAYLPEIARVLASNGRALLHYSAKDDAPLTDYRDDLNHWRNFGNEAVVLHFANRCGFSISEHFVTSWPPRNGGPATDGIVLLEKASS